MSFITPEGGLLVGTLLALCYVPFVILIFALIMRAVFKIPTITNNLIQQTILLKEISETQKQILKNQKEKHPTNVEPGN